jgi:hypothetical protein
VGHIALEAADEVVAAGLRGSHSPSAAELVLGQPADTAQVQRLYAAEAGPGCDPELQAGEEGVPAH